MRLIMRVVLLGLLLGLGALLVWQNPLPLVLNVLGTKTQPIALGVLLFGSVCLGLLTGGLLLFLLQGDRSLVQSASRPRKPATSPKVRRLQKPNKPKTGKSKSSSFPTSTPSDWSEPIFHDWSGTAAKVSATEYVSRTPREDWDRPSAAPSDRVVDADYRVLRPPSVPPRDPEWEDDFFDEP